MFAQDCPLKGDCGQFGQTDSTGLMHACCRVCGKKPTGTEGVISILKPCSARPSSAASSG